MSEKRHWRRKISILTYCSFIYWLFDTRIEAAQRGVNLLDINQNRSQIFFPLFPLFRKPTRLSIFLFKKKGGRRIVKNGLENFSSFFCNHFFQSITQFAQEISILMDAYHVPLPTNEGKWGKLKNCWGFTLILENISVWLILWEN